tara:strand:+ start:251 stop:505 length:255 start_codon:yes stop_codon:yes gene_type:complete
MAPAYPAVFLWFGAIGAGFGGVAAVSWAMSFVFNGLWCNSLAGLLMHYHLTAPLAVKMVCFQMHTGCIEWRCISPPIYADGAYR